MREAQRLSLNALLILQDLNLFPICVFPGGDREKRAKNEVLNTVQRDRKKKSYKEG